MRLSNNATIGLDLGSTGLRAVELRWKDGRPCVERWASAEFPEPITDWLNADAARVTSQIAQVTRGKGMTSRWVAHSVSGESVAPQYFNFPQLLPEDVAEAVRIEVEAALPFRSEQALVTHILFPDQRTPQGKMRTHGLAIAADQELVDCHLAMIRAVGLETFCVETDATACVNAFVTCQGGNGHAGATALLDIGQRSSRLALLGPDRTLLIRDMPWGGQSLTQAIAALLGVTPEQAEQIKQEHWMKGSSASLGERMPEALASSVGVLVGRLRDTVDYWVAERLVPALGRLYITGGASLVRGLPESLSSALHIPVEHWAPAFDGADFGAEKWRMGVACGLALRSMHSEASKS